MVSNHHKRKIRTSEELVPNPHTSEKLVQNYHRWEELVLNRHRWQWQNCAELKSNAKWSRFGGIFQCEEYACMLYEIWLRAYCSQSVRYCYEVCDILVPILHVLWGFCTNSSQCEIYEMWNLRFNRADLLVFFRKYFLKDYNVLCYWLFSDDHTAIGKGECVEHGTDLVYLGVTDRNMHVAVVADYPVNATCGCRTVDASADYGGDNSRA